MPTWTGNAFPNSNWSTGGNWDTGSAPTLAQPALFTGVGLNGNQNVTITAGATCSNIDFTGYSGTANFANSLNIRGTGVNLGTTAIFSGAGGITINNGVSAASFTSNNRPWGMPIIYNQNGTGGLVHTYFNNWDVTDFRTDGANSGGNNIVIAASAGATITITNTLNIRNSVVAPTMTFIATNNAQIFSNPFSSAAGNLTATIQINSGVNTVTLSGLNLSGSLIWISGLMNVVNTLTLFGSSSLNLPAPILMNNIIQNGNTILTLLSDVNCNNFNYGNNSGSTLSLTGGFRMKIRGNLLVSSPSAITGGTGILSMIGTGSISTVGNPRLNNALETNTLGTITLFSLNFSSTWTHTPTGTVLGGSSIITLYSGAVMNTAGINFFSIIVINGASITINSLLSISSNLTLNGGASFAGTAGWATLNFTHGGATFICTLQAGNTYTVNGIFTMNGTSSASRAVLQSSDAVAVTAFINASSNQLNVTAGSPVNPAAGYVLGSTSTALPPALNDLLPDRPTILSGSASPYTLVNAIGTTALASGSYTLGKKAIFIVTNGTGSTNVSYVTTRDIDSNGGITILAFGSYSDQIGNPTANLFRTLNWGPLIAPSGSAYFTFVN